MRCPRAASPAGGPGVAWMPRCHGRSPAPGARRASARRDLIIQPAPGTVPVAVSVVFILAPRTAMLAFSSSAGHPHARIPTRS